MVAQACNGCFSEVMNELIIGANRDHMYIMYLNEVMLHELPVKTTNTYLVTGNRIV